MTTAERYADELVDLAKSKPGVSDGLVRFEQIFDAYMIETPGDFVDKRKALLDAFQAKAPCRRAGQADPRQAGRHAVTRRARRPPLWRDDAPGQASL